jgi:hypothetical protein
MDAPKEGDHFQVGAATGTTATPALCPRSHSPCSPWLQPNLPLLVWAARVPRAGWCGPHCSCWNTCISVQITVDVPKDAYYLDFVFV